jgi:hypothetical protein
VILEDFAARPHSSGANVQELEQQSSKTSENHKAKIFKPNSPMAQGNAARAAIVLIV